MGKFMRAALALCERKAKQLDRGKKYSNSDLRHKALMK
jgi:hypothetical protein